VNAQQHSLHTTLHAPRPNTPFHRTNPKQQKQQEKEEKRQQVFREPLASLLFFTFCCDYDLFMIFACSLSVVEGKNQ